jgi:hypothetical protein
MKETLEALKREGADELIHDLGGHVCMMMSQRLHESVGPQFLLHACEDPAQNAASVLVLWNRQSTRCSRHFNDTWFRPGEE